MAELTKEIREIKERNARVEADKSWETSNTRRAMITIAIYVFAAVLFVSIRIADPLINALIPAVAFLLSTMTLPVIKNYWVRNIYKRK